MTRYSSIVRKDQEQENMVAERAQAERLVESMKTPEKREYTVKPGDNLSKIAKSQNIDLKELMKLNPEVKTEKNYLIFPNQKLRLPTKPAESPKIPETLTK